MTCAMCMEPSPKLFSNNCCDTIICERCAQLKKPCTQCKLPCVWQYSLVVTRIASQLKVDCPLGCGEETTYGDMERHKSESCLSAIVHCPHVNCHLKLRRRNIERHCEEECQFRNELWY